MPEKKWSTVVEPFPESFLFNDVGDVLEGKFDSRREVEQDDLAHPGKKRMAPVYTIVDADGKSWSVWGCWAIDSAMEKIDLDKVVRITYDGKAPLDGGRTFRKFLVQVAA